jgi:hypothetical protein
MRMGVGAAGCAQDGESNATLGARLRDGQHVHSCLCRLGDLPFLAFLTQIALTTTLPPPHSPPPVACPSPLASAWAQWFRPSTTISSPEKLPKGLLETNISSGARWILLLSPFFRARLVRLRDVWCIRPRTRTLSTVAGSVSVLRALPRSLLPLPLLRIVFR